MQNLDLWLEFIDTGKIIPLFERNYREYVIPKLVDVDWSNEPTHLTHIARDRVFSAFTDIESEEQYIQVFEWLWKRNERDLLLQSFKYLWSWLTSGESHLIK